MMHATVEQISAFLDDRVLASRIVDSAALVDAVTPLDAPHPGALSFATWDDDATRELIRQSCATLLLVLPGVIADLPDLNKNLIEVDRPRLEFSRVVYRFATMPTVTGVADTAHVDPAAVLGERAYVGPGAVVGPEVTMGSDCRIDANAVLTGRVTLGDRVVVGPGAVLGHTGFGYEREPDGTPVLMPHFAGVKVGDDVEIGAGACIDRGVFRDTFVDDHVKIDNLVQIGHNVRIGRGTSVIANAVICGSVTIGESAWIGPGVIVMEGLTIGERATVGLNSTVMRSVPAKMTVVAAKPQIVPFSTHRH